MPIVTQRYVAEFPIDELVEHPDNPRRGDEKAIEASMAHHGFYGSVLVQESTNRLIAGNHRTRVARRRGETTVPALVLNVDDDQARRILLADNRTNDLAGYDDAELARLLADLEGGLVGTGFDDADLDALLAELAEPDPDMPTPSDERYTPSWVFDGMGLEFDLDVAAPVNVAQRRVPARRHLTIVDDGLASPWHGLVWMNPPYSNGSAWARRWTEHPDGVCLLSFANSVSTVELCESAALMVLAVSMTFTTPLDQSGQVLWPTFMAAKGTGAAGLERLADRCNWPMFRSPGRPRPAEPMDFPRTALGHVASATT